jgi:NAD(P)-dependent dehydrogenase (short-subunit alcohol dehydrogenase family)
MRELAGKTAFVTGGAGGIGFALGRAFAEAGMNVMLADIETDALAAAVKSLHNLGPDVRGVLCDVADPSSVARRKRRTRHSEMSTWFATMPVSPLPAASTTSRSTIGDGCSTST